MQFLRVEQEIKKIYYVSVQFQNIHSNSTLVIRISLRLAKKIIIEIKILHLIGKK